MEGIILGQYVPGNSFLHRLDPRIKLIISGVLIWFIFFLKNPLEYMGLGVFIIFLYFLSGFPSGFLHVFKPGFYIILFTLLVNMFFTPGQSILSFGPMVITREGIIQGLTIGCKLIFFISLSSLVTFTTSLVRLTDGLQMLMRPFKKVGLPVGELVVMINIALRFIPTFWEETDKIIKAQVSRGADFNSWHLGRRIKYLTALLVPLFVNAFHRADELSMAMEARGYMVGMKRTSLYELRLNLRDYIVLVLMLILSAAFISYRL